MKCTTNLCEFFCLGQPECAYYLRHARCGFGPSCKFHHPEPGTSSISQDLQAPPETSLGVPQSDPTSFIATGIPATATATGIPASAAAVTGIPVASATAGAPGLPHEAAGVPVMPQGTPAPETLSHDAAASSITAAQTDAAVSTASQQQYATLPSQAQQAAAATSLQAASVAVPNMHMPAVTRSMPANVSQLPALQQSQVHALHASAPLQQAALPSIAAGMEATLPAQFVMQPEPAQQAGQAQQAQQGFQQQVAVPAAGVPLQSWPLTATVAAAPTAQAGTAPAPAQQASANPAVTHAQVPIQQVSTQTAPVGFSGVQQPTSGPPGQTVMVLPTASASPQHAYTSQHSQAVSQHRPAQFASSSTTAMQVPAGESLDF